MSSSRSMSPRMPCHAVELNPRPLIQYIPFPLSPQSPIRGLQSRIFPSLSHRSPQSAAFRGLQSRICKTARRGAHEAVARHWLRERKRPRRAARGGPVGCETLRLYGPCPVGCEAAGCRRRGGGGDPGELAPDRTRSPAAENGRGDSGFGLLGRDACDEEKGEAGEEGDGGAGKVRGGRLPMGIFNAI